MINYIDLWVKKIDDKLLETAYKLGYRVLGVEGLNKKTIRKNHVLLVSKIVVSAKRKKELKKKLEGIKTRSVLVGVRPLSIEVARMAAHDKRIDTIIIDDETLYYIDKTQIHVMKYYRKPLELPLSVFLSLSTRKKAMIYRRIKLYIDNNMPLLVSSMSKTWSELYEPISLIYLLKELFEMPLKEALLTLTNYPLEILASNGVKP